MSDKTPPPRRGLGRGLDALLGTIGPTTPVAPVATPAVVGQPAAATPGPTPATPPRSGLVQLPIGAIRAGRFQPRRRFMPEEIESLAQSIREKGVLQPILVRALPAEPGRYEIVAGERRWRAAQQAQLHEIPAILRDLTDRDALEVALVENLQRADLSPIEEAEGYQRLMQEFRHTQEDLARIIGKSRSHLANTLRLLTLPQAVKALLDDASLSPGHARLLVGMEPGAAAVAAQSFVIKGLSVRDAERAIRAMKDAESGHRPAKSGKRGAGERSADISALERDLANRLGLAVEIHHRGEAGQIVIKYKTLEQLDDLIARIGRGEERRR